MNDLTIPYNRIEHIFTAIESLKFSLRANENRIPIRRIAEKSAIPMEVFRADLYCILEVYRNYGLEINGEEIWERYSRKNEKGKEAPNKIAYKKDLLAGKWDDADLILDNRDTEKMIPLSAEESSIMEHLFYGNSIDQHKSFRPFIVKDSYHFMIQDEEGINEILYNIKSAIQRNREIKITDLGKPKESVITVKPIRLFYDSTENLYAVICLDEDTIKAYRIDKIKYMGEGKGFCVPDDIKKRLKIVPNVWGLCFDEKPLNVRVRIFASHSRGKVGKNVKKDLERRTNGKLYEDGDSLIYEDKVYGEDAFLRWVFGYGSSIVVEKPVKLRRKIIKILEEELKKDG